MCCCSVPKSHLTLCHPKDCSTTGSSVLHFFLEFAQIHVHWVSDAIWPSHSLLPSSLLPSIFPSIRFFSNEFALWIRWPKYRSFSFSRSPSNEYSDLISFRMDWFDLLAVEETLKSLLQHHSSKPSVFRCSTFFMVQLSHVYMTTGKTIALCLWRFILIFGKTNTIMQSFKNKIKLKKKKELSAKKRKTNKQTNHSFDYVQFCQPQRGPG